MYKKLLLAALLFSVISAKAQKDSIYAEIFVTGIYLDDSKATLDTPRCIIVEKTGCTDIIPIGKIEHRSMGIQFALIPGKLGGSPILVMGMNLYLYLMDGWVRLTPFGFYEKARTKTITGKSDISEKDFLDGAYQMSGRSDPQDFYVHLRSRYYFIR